MTTSLVYVLVSVPMVWQKETSKFTLKETGGILVGYRTKSGNFVITHTTGPGPRAKHGFRYFEADSAYCQRVLDHIFDHSQGELTYLGDWHTHPLGGLLLSRLDVDTMRIVANDELYQCSLPLSVIYKPRWRYSRRNMEDGFAVYAIDANGKSTLLEVKLISKILGYRLPKI